MKTVINIALLLLVSTALSHAATLTLTVKEKGTGDPVGDASVVLIKGGESETSNAQGQLSIDDVDLPDQLKILALGYEVMLVDLRTDKPLTVYLMPISGESEALVVEVERIQQKVSKISLSSDEIRRAPGTGGDPLRVIESLPGVVTATGMAGGGGGGLYLRGSDQNENLVVVNRAPIGYLYHLGGIYSTIHPKMIHDFNAFLGGFPVEYGDVLGGVLDVKLRSPKRDRLRQSYSIGTYQSSVFLEGPVGEANGDQGFFLAARRSYIDLILSPEDLTKMFDSKDDGTPDNQTNKVVQVPVFSDVQALWEIDTQLGTFSAAFFNASDEARFLIQSQRSFDPQSAGETGISASYNSLSFNLESQWGKGYSSSMPLTFYRAKSRVEIGNDENNQPFFIDIESNDVVFQPELRQQLSNGNQWRTGFQTAYSRTPVDARITREPMEADQGAYLLTDREKFRIDSVYKGQNLSPYIDYQHHWSDRLSTTVGLRYSRLSIDNSRARISALQPRAQAEFKLDERSYLTAAWGKYVQSPAGSQMIAEIGNPDLNYTETEHRVLGYKRDLVQNVSLLVEAFHKPMTQLVTAIDDNAPPHNFSNEGKGDARGIDLLLKKNFSNRSSGWLSYSYIKTTRTGRDGIERRFSGDQPHTLSLVWSQAMTGSWHKWDIGVRMRYHSGALYDPIIGTELSSDGLRTVPTYSTVKNSARMPDFYQLDLRLDRKVRHNTWTLNYYIDIFNILNTQNVTGYDYGVDLEKVGNPDEEYNLPLFPTFGIEAEF